MFRVLCFAVVIMSSLFWAGVGGYAQGECVYFDDFNDGVMDSSFWTLFIEGAGPTAREAAGYVEVTIPPEAYGGNIAGGYKSARCLRGDFDIQVDYYLIEWPTGSGVRVGLGLWPAKPPGQLGSVQRDSFSSKESWELTEAYAVDYQKSGGGVPTTHMCGSLRLVRVGNRLFSGALADGEWVELHSDEFSTDDCYFAFNAWTHDYAFDDKLVRVGFENFVLNYGELVDASAPPPAVAKQSLQVRERTVAGVPTIKSAALRAGKVVVMPHGAPLVRMPRLPAKACPATCGPYSRLKISIPKTKAKIPTPAVRTLKR